MNTMVLNYQLFPSRLLFDVQFKIKSNTNLNTIRTLYEHDTRRGKE